MTLGANDLDRLLLVSIGINPIFTGLIKYGERVQKVFGMDTYKTRREIEHAVSLVTSMFGKPRTGLALYHALNHGFTKEGGSRPGAAKVR